MTATTSLLILTVSTPPYALPRKKNLTLPFSFWDVLVERQNSDSVTSVYRKPTFTGQYLRCNSFSPTQRKTDLISTLVHRAFMICLKSKLEPELNKIRSIFINNGYPEDVITSTFQRKLKQLHARLIHSADKFPVYLYVPRLGNVSTRFEKQISSAVKRCYFAVEPCVVLTTRQLLPSTKKDVLPSHHCSNLVYVFVCHCDGRYVGRTSQRLQERIKRHIPKFTISTSQRSLPRWCKANSSS